MSHLAIATFVTLFMSAAAQAADFFPLPIADLPDSDVADGLCADATGKCTLRAAFMQASYLPGPDRIVLGAGNYDLTIENAGLDGGATGILEIHDDVELIGAGPGGDPSSDSIVTCHTEGAGGITLLYGHVSISGLRLAGCSRGIWNYTSVDVDDVTLAGTGDGFYNTFTGRLMARNVVLDGNSIGLTNFGVASVDRTTALNNGMSAIENYLPGVLQLTNSMVVNNTVCGAAIYSEGTLLMSNSTVAFTHYIEGCPDPAGISNSGTASLVNVTVDYNANPSVGSVDLLNSGTLTARNSIIYECDGDDVVSAGHNAVGFFCGGFTAEGDHTGVGLTYQWDSTGVVPALVPLVNPVTPKGGSDAGCPLMDQRGYARPPGSCDIGAAQRGSDAPACSNGIDDDGDGAIDDADTGCSDPNDPQELRIQPRDLLIAENGSQAITQMDPVNGTTTVLSRGLGMSSPYGVAVEASGSVVVSDSSGLVFRIDSETSHPTLIAAKDELSIPRGIDIEANGDIVVADRGTKQIVRIDPTTGSQSVVSDDPAFSGLEGLSVHPDGTLLVSELSNAMGQGIRRVHPATGIVTGVFTGGHFGDPRGTTIGATGELFATDTTADAVVELDLSSGAQNTVVTGMPGVWGIATEDTGYLVVTERFLGEISRVDPATGDRTVLNASTPLATPLHLTVVPTKVGDLNNDGIVGGPDFVILSICFGQSVGPEAGPASDPTCARSDLNDDGIVGGADFVLFSLSYGN